jgi:hypothetical protein
MRKRTPESKTLGFFGRIACERPNFRYAEFEKHWYAIENLNLGFSDLTEILHATSIALNNLQDRELEEDCQSLLTYHFDIWENKALPLIQGSPQDEIGLCMLATSALDLNFSKKFRSAWAQNVKESNSKKTRELARPVFDRMRDPKLAHLPLVPIFSSAMANILPPEKIYTDWETKTTPILSTFSGENIAYGLYSYGRLGRIPSDAWLQAWRARFDTLLSTPDAFRHRELANIIGTAFILHTLTNNPAYVNIAQRASNQVDYETCSIPERRQIAYAWRWFGFDEGIEIPMQKQQTVSEHEKTLLQLFLKAGAIEAPTPPSLLDNKINPDFIFDVNGKLVIFEDDGSLHFLNKIRPATGKLSKVEYDGPTRSMSAYKLKMYPTTYVHLPFNNTSTLIHRQFVEPNEFSHLLSSAAALPTGSYYLRTSRDTTALEFKPMNIASMQTHEAG